MNLNHNGCAVSVIIGTRNRAATLGPAIESVLVGRANALFEVIVVDNASDDDTSIVARRLQDAGHPVRYLVESRRGVSFARNLGARSARAPVLAFMDDDQIAAPEWVDVIAGTFDEHPDVDFAAGRVLPAPAATLPEWVTSETRGALSIIDPSATPRAIDAANWMCLPGGNMACRRQVFEAVGGFHAYARSEDRELTVRLLQAGYAGRYVPEMLMYHDVDPARVTRSYFREWMAVEGRIRARYRFAELFDRGGAILQAPLRERTIFGVSRFVYRELLAEAGRWAGAFLRRRHVDAFAHELKARYLAHYVLGVVAAERQRERALLPPRAARI